MSPPAPSDHELQDIEIRLLLEALYLRYQHDFRGYAGASLRRRLALGLQQLGFESLAALQHAVLREPALLTRLLQVLTVQVSEMFRDPQHFRRLREVVVPALRTYPSLKVWVAGCGHGEEVWSLAILLHEEGLLDRTIVYATDIHPQALHAAEAGVFPLERVAGYSRNYLEAGGLGSLSDYYTSGYDGVIFDRALKRQIVFADHSLATDAVFSEVHLVSCRNVLIYFDRGLQDRAVGLFREALVRHGFLGLGTRETVQFGAHASAFETLSGPSELRWYRRV